MKIIIETIDHKLHRYPTIGDYWVDENGDWQIRVSKMGDTLYEVMVAIHELTEFALLNKKGITEPDIMKFDLEFEEKIKKGEVGENDEPGFAKDSPYLKEHTIATSIEMSIAAISGINWDEYNKKLNSLFDEYNK